jgi:beta-barrel assembly-enhancing protease
MRRSREDTYEPRQKQGGCAPRLLLGLGIAIFSIVSFMSSSSVNPVTGEKQYVKVSAQQEVAMGLQAAPEMAQQFGGAITSGPEADIVRRVGSRLVQRTKAKNSEYRFEFHLLRDGETINAFALPGGQVFITMGLLSKLETEGQLAGVLGHEIGHVIGRHGAEHMAKGELMQGLVGAVGAASDGKAMAIAQMAAQMANLKYGRQDEHEADTFGLDYIVQAGYDPRGILGVMKVLEEASKGNRQPEWMSSHPLPANRIEELEDQIRKMFPNGVPSNLIP